jgi:hypothetical protein
VFLPINWLLVSATVASFWQLEITKNETRNMERSIQQEPNI